MPQNGFDMAKRMDGAFVEKRGITGQRAFAQAHPALVGEHLAALRLQLGDWQKAIKDGTIITTDMACIPTGLLDEAKPGQTYSLHSTSSHERLVLSTVLFR